METSSSSIISTLIHHPSSFPVGLPHRNAGLYRSKKPSTVGLASRRGDFGGGLVDENMIMLRKRIHEMKMVERNYEPPSDWMDWEKRYYTSYDSDVCKVVGLLQILLMNTRPSLAIGMLALVALSVPTSMIMVSSHLLEALQLIFSGPYLSGS